jgi:hypothetical protein
MSWQVNNGERDTKSFIEMKVIVTVTNTKNGVAVLVTV